MVRINQAWELLRDPVKRAAVDRARTRNAGAAAQVVSTDARAAAAEAARRPRPNRRHRRERRTKRTPATGPRPPHRRRPPRPIGRRGRRAEAPARVTGLDVRAVERGGGYDATTMRPPSGPGTAGPPPGNPSGSVLKFGRYVGWSLGEIARTDIEYLEWLDRMPIGRTYQAEIDELLRSHGRRVSTAHGRARREGCSAAADPSGTAYHSARCWRMLTLWITPSPIAMLTSDAPPWLMNGSGMPVTGISPMTIPTFTNTWNSSIDASPAPNSVPNGSFERQRARQDSPDQRREQQEHDERAR